jgi:zinc transport system permease protein
MTMPGMITRAIVMDDFVVRAFLGGLGLAAVAGPLGSFIVWRRMAFFGDALAHSALLGVALALLLHINLVIGVVVICAALALVLTTLQPRLHLAGDTILGIFSHSALAFGLVALSFLDTVRIDLMGFLFGDILAVTPFDLAWIYGGGAAVLATLLVLWRPLLAVTVHEELAQVEGVPVEKLRLAFVLLLAIVIAAAMKIVGALLITSLLIVPAAAARNFARTPEQMAALAAGLGALAVAAGLGASMQFDTPSGPSIVVVAALLFAASAVLRRRSA